LQDAGLYNYALDALEELEPPPLENDDGKENGEEDDEDAVQVLGSAGGFLGFSGVFWGRFAERESIRLTICKNFLSNLRPGKRKSSAIRTGR
jgi:hypothetical protein